MTNKNQTFELVKALSEGRGENFVKLLELHGVPESELTEYMERANNMAKAMVEMCRCYCVQTNQENGKLFASLATGMAMDALLHTLITKEQSNLISVQTTRH